MAPHAEDEFDEEEEIDFSDLRAQYEVRMDQGLDTFVVIDGCPVVPEDARPKLLNFLKKKFAAAGKVKDDGIFMPIGGDGNTQGFCFIEYESAEQAVNACNTLDDVPIDKKHRMKVNKLTDIEHFGREGRINEDFEDPEIAPFEEQEHLRSWIGEPNARDQIAMYRGDNVGVFSNRKSEALEPVVDRVHWTESFIQWSPLGTYLTSVHAQGVQLWGGPSWSRIRRFAHPFVNLVDFSPQEAFMVTWSNKPIQLPDPVPASFPLGPEHEGANFVIWDISTGRVARAFPNVTAAPSNIEQAQQDGKPRTKIQWPSFKWSADDKYLARLDPEADKPGRNGIAIFDSSDMKLIGKKKVLIEGVVDFEWSPAVPTSTGGKGAKPSTEYMLAYWTPEMNNQTARAGLMAIPSKEVVRTRNLVNVSECRLHWQSEGKYLCVKVDRHTKTKKSTYTSLEFFRVVEKNIPVEIIELKQIVINFAWETKGDRFVFITMDEAVAGAAVAPKTNIHFYAPEKVKNGVGEWSLVKLVEKKTSNAIYWSPRGRFVVIAVVLSQGTFDLDFWDFDFEGEKQKTTFKNKELCANLMQVGQSEHYGVTDVEWDPTGRYVATSASFWKHQMENGYHLYDFKGALLREEAIERFKQFLWRPRPPTMLPKEQQKHIRKNLREYSKQFEEEDEMAASAANKEEVDARMRALEEWLAWRERVSRDVELEKTEIGWKDPMEGLAEGDQVIEELVEEVISESEEVVD